MFKHQVLEDLKKYPKTNEEKYIKFLKFSLLTIPKVHGFHFTNVEYINKMFLSENKKITLFKDYILENKDDIRLPYEIIWVDFNINKIHYHFSKLGCLLSENQDDINMAFYGCGKKEFNEWVLLPFITILKFNTVDIEFHFLNEIYKKQCQRDPEETTSIIGLILIIVNFILLLNCKNITTRIIRPPKRLNKTRINNNKVPLYEYKILEINPFDKKKGTINRNAWENRLHFSRGHFKVYTEEAPLFGKVVGRFWWQPQLRGKNTDSFIDKDYDVKN